MIGACKKADPCSGIKALKWCDVFLLFCLSPCLLLYLCGGISKLAQVHLTLHYSCFDIFLILRFDLLPLQTLIYVHKTLFIKIACVCLFIVGSSINPRVPSGKLLCRPPSRTCYNLQGSHVRLKREIVRLFVQVRLNPVDMTILM